MVELRDGPAKGAYLIKRVPLFLRAVVEKGTGKVDVLDQLNDCPRRRELVYVYKRQGEASEVHINSVKVKGYYAMGRYYYLPDVNGEALRETKDWQDWCKGQVESCPFGDRQLQPGVRA